MMRQVAEIQHEDLNHPDLRPSRTKRDEGDVKSLTEILKDVWQNPFSLEPQELSSISTGASPFEEAIIDLCNAQKIGKKAHDEFFRRRLLKDGNSQFFDTLPHIKLISLKQRQRRQLFQNLGKKLS